MSKKIIRAIKVQVVVTKTMWVYEDEFKAESYGTGQEFNEFNAINFTKGTLIEELRNDPNRGSAKILDYGAFEVTEE